MSETEREPGAWVVYAHDHGPFAIALFRSAEEAAKDAAGRGYGAVAHWPFGDDFDVAIRKWEDR